MPIIDLFRPKWRHSDPEVRKLAVVALEHSAKLEKVVTEDPDPEIQLAALRRLDSISSPLLQKLLRKIATTSKDRDLIRYSVGLLSDPEVLVRVVLRNDGPRWEQLSIALPAIEKIHNVDMLRTISEEAENASVRGTATERGLKLEDEELELEYEELQKETDPNRTLSVVLTHKNPSFRRLVTGRIDDQSVLARIARMDDCPEVRTEATSSLEDHEILRRCLLEDGAEQVRASALRRILALAPLWDTTDALLVDVALREPASEIRCIAVAHMRSNESLQEIAVDADDSQTRRQAIITIVNNRVSPYVFGENALSETQVRQHKGADTSPLEVFSDNQRLLTQITQLHPVNWVRLEAIRLLTDQSAIRTVARTSVDYEVKLEAVKALGALEDQEALAAIALEDKDQSVQRSAIEALTDVDLLIEVVRKTELDDFRRVNGYAMDRIVSCGSQKTLADLAIRGGVDCPSALSTEAALAITDPDQLARIAIKAARKTARKIAAEKVTNSDVLVKVAMGDKDHDIALSAMRKVKGSKSMSEIATSAKLAPIRLKAIPKVKDKELLARIAKEDPDEEVRREALLASCEHPETESLHDTRNEREDGGAGTFTITEQIMTVTKCKICGKVLNRSSRRGNISGDWKGYR